MLEKAKNFIVENKKTAMVVVGIVLVGAGAFGIKKKFFGKNKAEKKEDPKEAPKAEKKEDPKNEGFENPK